jgi:hypothetical protein
VVAIEMPAMEERFGVRRDCGGMRRLRGKAGERFGQLPRGRLLGPAMVAGGMAAARNKARSGPELGREQGRN